MRNGKRHGSPPAHEAAADSALRSRTVRLAALPALLVTVLSVGALVFVLRSQDDGGDGVSWGVTIGMAVLGCGIVTAAAAMGDAQARATLRRYAALRRAGVRGRSDLQELLRRLGDGERIQLHPHAPVPDPEGDALDLLSHEFTRAQRAAEDAVVQAAQVIRGETDSDDKVEVFVNLARRLQSLVHREIELLDELENEVEDPDLLKGLFQVDHLATRIRRHAENLAVLGGAVSRRQWSRPVTLTEVLRSSIAEVEHYSRVKLVPPIDGTLRGHAVADVIHLLAELVENATIFSAPQTQVLLRAQHVAAGLAVEVEDRGLGMPRGEQERMNALLADPERIDVGELLRDGRIGLFVVSSLARRHGIAVQLQSNIYGGVQAVLVLPQALLGSDETAERAVPHTAAAPAAAVPPPRTEQVSVPAPRREQAPLAAPQHVRGPGPMPAPATAPAAAAPASPPPAAPQHTRAADTDQMAVRAMETNTPPAPSGAANRSGDATGDRPELPRRRRQEHLAPELRDAPPSAASSGSAGNEAEHNPELMAAFRRGFSLADRPETPDENRTDTPS
ncbi:MULTISPECIES: ATP-binding protein [Streptomyces]|uniref:sensor histidine kinase n=1 Tax=Streptomyces TaxID=1883 RepID=UPI001F3ED170|nr:MULTISPECIES: ATP-binding protein [Streptomyces]